MLSNDDLSYVAAQISNGAEYLESLRFVHRLEKFYYSIVFYSLFIHLIPRDYAARNVLVGSDLSVKISDFGLGRTLDNGSYYKTQVITFKCCFIYLLQRFL
jgi:serine/threonine protein kinase